ncbi:MAG: CapA family protein [Patescibacteria group bacterium]
MAQVLSLQPSWFLVKEHSVGNLSQVTEKAKVYVAKTFTEATLSSVNSIPYDTVVFTGDVMLGRYVETLMIENGSTYPYSALSLNKLSAKPAVVGNFEAAMALIHTQTPHNTLRFSVSNDYLEAFSEQFTHASLANNHSLDFNEEAYLNTVHLLEKQSVDVFGHNSRIDKSSLSYLETKRGVIALLGINASQHIPEESELVTLTQKAKRRSDFQVAYIHWGDEYEPKHSDTQEVLAGVLVTAGVDLIIGHHPHVVQDIDLINGVPVFYSLGNYIFDQYFSSEVKQGLVVALRLEETPALELIPVSSKEKKSRPTQNDDLSRQTFLNELASRSHPSLKESIEAGRINLFEPVATSTKMAIMWQ